MASSCCAIRKEVSPASIFILITGVPTIDTAIAAVNFGADRYVIKGDRLARRTAPRRAASG